MGVTLPRDHSPLRQTDFFGQYARGVSDNCPDRYQINTQNVKYAEGDVLTRDGLVLGVTKSSIVRSFTYKRLNETPRQIILDTSGNLVDSLAPGVPIWTDAAIVDFSMVNYANRAYITVHNRLRGIPGKYLLVYQGSGSARLAAGSAPSGFTLSAAVSASAGNVEAGIHLFAVCGLTDTGFITAPGPAIFAQVTAPGGTSIDLSNISTLIGTQWVGRVLVATKSIPIDQFTGNQFGYEMFFIPSGTINDNTSTTKTVSFFDSDLQNSADYLLDQLAQIPAGLGVTVYQNRLVTWAENGNEFTIRLSKSGFPEAFDSVAGFINLDPSDSISGVRNCAEGRSKAFIICTQNRIYATADNGDDPNTWPIGNAIEKSNGTECFGIATVLDARGINVDRMFIATQAGLQTFDGVLRRPELSFNIEDEWKRINKSVFNLVQVVDDPLNHRIFISVPLDGATSISHILYADYSKAFTIYQTIDETKIKWATWVFPSAPVSISGDKDPVTNKSILHIALTNNVYDMKDGITDDFGNAIDSWIWTSLKTAGAGWINHFGGMKLRVKGNGLLQISMYGEDEVFQSNAPSITLQATPGREFDQLINVLNEKCSVKLRVNNFGEYFTLSEFTLWAKPVYLRRPQ
jgi:hypothetical protein